MGEKVLIALNVVILLSLLGAYYYRASVPPVDVKIEDARSHLGEYVEVGGIVWRSWGDEDYTTILITEDFNSTLTVFARFSIEVPPGARIVVRGILAEVSGGIEILPEKPGDIRILSREYSAALPVLLENPERYVGLLVKFPAKVKYSRIVYLNLTDEFGSVRGYVDDYDGDRNAFFHGRVKNGKFLVDFASDICVDGYQEVNTSSILSHEGEKVCLHAKIYDYGLKLYVSSGNYTLPVYCELPEIPEGNVVVEGTFTYDSLSGRYVVYAGNVI